jgi:hypothetical protein
MPTQIDVPGPESHPARRTTLTLIPILLAIVVFLGLAVAIGSYIVHPSRQATQPTDTAMPAGAAASR